MVTGGSNKVIKLWDVKTGQQIAEGAGHSGPINSVHFSADDKQIVTGGRDGVIILWNVFI
jgi:WD40 repeat protein